MEDLTPSLFRCAIDPLFEVVNEEGSVNVVPRTSPDEAGVVLVFLVPGRVVGSASFEGIRTSTYFKEHHSKQLQVAVPPDLETREDLREFLADVFVGAPSVASKALQRQRVPASVECASQAAERVIARLDEVVDRAWLAHERAAR